MTRVLAGLDSSSAARAVLETAIAVADLTGATVEAVHAHDGAPSTPAELAARRDVPFRLLDGPPADALVDAIADPDVIMAVVGARALPGGRRPVGHTALTVLTGTQKPVVVVPPDAVGNVPNVIRRVLVPLDGTAAAARSFIERLLPLAAREVEAFVVHVFSADRPPPVLDHPVRDKQLFAAEFLARFLPHAVHMELRVGPVAPAVLEMAAHQHVDLIVMSWAQDASEGRAAVISDVLARSPVPVAVVPVVAGPSALTRTGARVERDG